MKQTLIQCRALILVIILSFINLTLSGCFTLREVRHEDELPRKVYKIEMLDGKVIDFSDSKQGYAYLNGKEIISVNKDSTQERYSMAYVKKCYTKKFDLLKSFGLVLLTAGTISLSIIAMFFIEMDGRGLGG